MKKFLFLVLATVTLSASPSWCCYYQYHETYPYTGGLPPERIYQMFDSDCAQCRVSHQSEISFVFRKTDVSYQRRNKTLKFFQLTTDGQEKNVIHIQFEGVDKAELKRLQKMCQSNRDEEPPRDYYFFELARMGCKAVNLANGQKIDFRYLSHLRP